ncbi:MAG: hypothetical protein HS115_03445 [Spirochaetales bacterium]|nr:hypothetical protein [Spirochaetales bacterium]
METNTNAGWKDRLLLHIDVIAACVLGLATIAAAFAAYQSALWGGNCLTAYNQAVIRFGDANREYLNGALGTSFDTMIYLESLREDGRTKEDVDKMMTKDLVRAITWSDTSYDKKRQALTAVQIAELEGQIEEKWGAFEEAKTPAEEEKVLAEILEMEKKVAYLPFLESDSYKQGKRSTGDAMTREAQVKLEEGIKANMTGDAFTLMTVYFTIALFFAGMASVLKEDRIRLGFLAGSVVVFLFAFVRMILMPFA